MNNNIFLNLNKKPLDKSLLWSFESDLYNKYTQYIEINDVKEHNEIIENIETYDNTELIEHNEIIENKGKSVNMLLKEKKETPLNIILKLTNNAEINIDYVKQKLIEIISQKNYMKLFGVKKSSEIMNSICENKFTTSYVLFLSFLLNKRFLYKKKIIDYYKDTNIDKEFIEIK